MWKGVAIGVVVVVALGGAIAGAFWYRSTAPARQIARAEAASRAGRWAEALDAWRAVNASPKARGTTHLAEARAALALGRAGEAETALERAVNADPSDLEPWRLRLELLRVEDNPLEAQRVGWLAYAAVPPSDRRAVLRETTLALLADLPDDLARRTLDRWAAAGSGAVDLDNVGARVALLQRVAAMPRSGDPDHASRVSELSALSKARPENTPVREALVTALAEVGESAPGREALDAWPEVERDARYWRLVGRWALEFDHDPKVAVDAFHRALVDLPHDWKTRARLARALGQLGRDAEARLEALNVSRLRELLDPASLGPRLAKDLDPARDDDPKAPADLADLCARAGLTRLAEAWRREANRPVANVREIR